jgi:hypothetical protein
MPENAADFGMPDDRRTVKVTSRGRNTTPAGRSLFCAELWRCLTLGVHYNPYPYLRPLISL